MAQAAYELERFADRPLDVKPRMRAVRQKAGHEDQRSGL